MLLVIDVGNTNIVLGVFENDTLLNQWRIRTERNATADEFFVLATSLFQQNGIKADGIDKIIISCVAPAVVANLESFCRKYFGRPPHWVDARSSAGMPIRYDNPAEVGADRIVNAVAAYARYKCSLIVIDFGTATTFDAVSPKGEYLGGAIAPGIMIASDALFLHASKLPRVDLHEPPPAVIGKNTINSIKSGILFGYAAMVDGMVRRMAGEMDAAPTVIATGGLAPLMRNMCETIQAVDPDLTLDGLRIISETV